MIGLAGIVAAAACKPSAPLKRSHVPLPPAPLEMPAYSTCPPNALKCDPARLRMLQDSLVAMQKRHRARDSLSRALMPPLDFRYHPPPEGPPPVLPWRGPDWEQQAPMDKYRRGLGLPPRDTPRAQRTSNS
jgi:hypothetical protein